MLRQYETTIIVDAHLPGEQIGATVEKTTKFIENHGGGVKFVDRWGKRRLAYEIAKKQYGYYVYIRFEAEGSFVKELEREFKLDSSILRYFTVLVSKGALREEMQRKSETKERKAEEVHEGVEKTSESSMEGGNSEASEEMKQTE